GGMPGERNLLSSPLELGTFHLLTVLCDSEKVTLRVDGQPHDKRDRKRDPMVLEELTVGARQIDLQGSAPYVQSFFHGDVAELIFFGRALSDSELEKVEDYFTRKHAGLLHRS